jgi:hypothetical protein
MRLNSRVWHGHKSLVLKNNSTLYDKTLLELFEKSEIKWECIKKKYGWNVLFAITPASWNLNHEQKCESKVGAYSMLMMGPGLGWTRHYKCLVQEAYKQPQSTFEIRFRDSKDQATTLLRVNIETTNKHSQVWGSQTLFFTVGWITSTTMNRCRDQRTQPRIVVTRACMLSIDKHRKHNYLTTLSWIHSYLTESWGLKTWWFVLSVVSLVRLTLF